ncbi:MAG: flagellar basal body rod C-terminal domain-containing protein, partial [Oscillospiraceae bacterium]
TRKEQEYNLENIAIPKVNDLLSGLKEVNASIRKEQLNGAPALELLDQKNALIDELSQYVKIDVKTTNVTVSPGLSYEETTINLVDNAGNPTTILDPKEGVRPFSAKKNGDGQYEIFITSPDGKLTDVTSEIPTGNFKGYLDMLNKSGEFDGAGVNTRGVGYYEGMLDNLAVTFATEMNKLNESIKNDKYVAGDPSTGPEFLVVGGPLFTNKDAVPPADPKDGITAGNIKISSGWANNEYGIVACTKEEAELANDATAANGNVLKMIALFSKKLDFKGKDTAGNDIKLFNGTFQEMLSQTGNVLALEVKSTGTKLKNFLGVVDGISAQRDAISAVSLDEEGISLLQYQKSYNAAARLMTTLDEAIGTIINNMGVIGR